ncbi:RNA polymerase sigma factor [Sphingobacterium sp. LRF_L2]|uniref:RNA polymerase sigma factor n=1 Tax=Sphingobacterium sp. LRF_L2 TaxID=3369421 RepID=UPI003F5E9E0C
METFKIELGITEKSADHQLLWTKFIQSDAHAFRQLHTLFHDMLYNYGYSFLPDHTFVSDCVQDLFVKLWQNRANLNSPPSPKHYLLRALRNVIYNKQQLKKRELYVGDLQDLDLLNGAAEVELPFYQQIPLSPLIEKHMQQLTGKQREAIYLYFVEDYSYAELATHFEMRTEGAYKLIYRALAALKTALEK